MLVNMKNTEILTYYLRDDQTDQFNNSIEFKQVEDLNNITEKIFLLFSSKRKIIMKRITAKTVELLCK
mgnify:CR=1 FL=1